MNTEKFEEINKINYVLNGKIPYSRMIYEFWMKNWPKIEGYWQPRPADVGLNFFRS